MRKMIIWGIIGKYMSLNERNIGDVVYKDGYTSMAQNNFGKVTITNIDYRFDEVTGDKFKIIQIDNGEWYDSRSGDCYSNKKSMYYIEE
jgi:hypothetical protein